MPDLHSTLNRVRKRIKQYRGTRAINEQNTKATLIEPLLRALGWNLEDLEEVQREYRRKKSNKPVDYGLFILREPRLFIEAKALGQNLSDSKWASQIMGYAAVAGVKWVVLTDGDEYRIYNSHASVPIEEKLFRSVRVSEESPAAEQTLALLSKDRLGEAEIDKYWNAYFVDRQVASTFEDMFAGEPDPSLLSLLRKRTGLGRADLKSSLTRARIHVEFPIEVAVEPGARPRQRRRPRATDPTRTARRSARRADSDTIVVPARKEGFEKVFLGENRWYAIRITEKRLGQLKYIAAYQSKPISAVTHIAEIDRIEPYKGTGKYMVVFKGPSQAIGPVPIRRGKNAPQGPVLVTRTDLLRASCLEDALGTT